MKYVDTAQVRVERFHRFGVLMNRQYTAIALPDQISLEISHKPALKMILRRRARYYLVDPQGLRKNIFAYSLH